MLIGKKLKQLRKEKGMTLRELSEKSGVQIATLCRMEHDRMTGTLDSHVRICEAFGISLSDFYREIEDETKTITVSKKGKTGETFVYSKKSNIELLVGKVMDKKMMPVIITIGKNGMTHKEENKTGAEKFVYVLEGRLLARIGKEEYVLSKGDSIYFDATLPHVFCNRAKGVTRILSMLSPPSF